MPEGIFVVTIPQLGVNDEMATVVAWYVPDEGKVSTGDPLYALETTKALVDIEAEATGHVVRLVEEGTEVKISQPIALIGSYLESLKVEKDRYVNQISAKSSAYVLINGSGKATKKAKKTAQRLGVDLVKVTAKGIIREQDVIQYSQKSQSAGRELSINLSWNPNRQPVIIYGAGRGAITLKECLDFKDTYQVVCFIDDAPQHLDKLLDLPVFHSSRLNEVLMQGVRNLTCAIANGEVRLRILRQYAELGIEVINVIHPRTYIAPTVRIGNGNYIKAGAFIETNTVIENCCIIDNATVIAHDNVIGNGCHLAPGAVLGSNINIGDLTIVGIGASIATGVRIGRSVIISVGSSVVRDVPDNAVVEGVPGKVVGKRKKS